MGSEITALEVVAPRSVSDILTDGKLIEDVLEQVMIEDVHYGIIPGTNKPGLYKPGSEKILSLFKIAVDPIVEDLSTADCARYRVTCRGVLMGDGQHFIGAGIGECSSDEEKYRWRRAVCDQEFDETPENRRRAVWKSFWDKQAGRKVPTKIKQVRTEPADQANTVLKMAKKRAQVDMTLTATAASDMFEQGEDNFTPGSGEDDGEKQQRRRPSSRSGGTGASGAHGNGAISAPQIARLYAKARESGWTEEQVKVWVRDTMKCEVGEIQKGTYDGIVNRLSSTKPPAAESKPKADDAPKADAKTDADPDDVPFK
jgi:hypothetical protein